MAKTLVSIPDELRARMDQAKEAGAEVNWSSVAAKAFDAKLADIVEAKDDPSLEEAAARMRFLKTQAAEADSAAGRREGVRWAKSKANSAQLARLETLVAGDWEGFKSASSKKGGSFPTRLATAIYGYRPFDRSVNSQLWMPYFSYRRCGSDELSNEFVDAFARGAVEVWQAIKDRV